MLIVLPFTPEAVQTSGGIAANVTGLEDPPPVAATVNGSSPTMWDGKALQVMVCEFCCTRKSRKTLEAAL
jgi:hypothetical protein